MSDDLLTIDDLLLLHAGDLVQDIVTDELFEVIGLVKCSLTSGKVDSVTIDVKEVDASSLHPPIQYTAIRNHYLNTLCKYIQ